MWGPALMKVIIISMVIDTKGYDDPFKMTCEDGPLNAEVGTGVIISCSYTHDVRYRPESFVWHVCDELLHFCRHQNDLFDDKMMIFHSANVNAGLDAYKGRVSLLEPDATLLNVSIVIRDLKVTDTGAYQLRVEGKMKGLRYTYWFRRKGLGTTIKVTGLAQPQITGKTTVMEGETLTLSCDAESAPPSVVVWAEGSSHIPLVTGTQSATLTITNATTDHSGRYRCTAHNITNSLTSVADVTVMSKFLESLEPPVISGQTTVEGGHTLNLTCQAQSSSPSFVTWTQADIALVNGTQTAILEIPSVTGEYSGRYRCTAKHGKKTLSSFADVTVIEKYPVPEKEGDRLFKLTTVGTYFIMTSVLVVLVLIGFGLAKIIRRRTEKKTYQAVAVEMVSQQTGGGVDRRENMDPGLEGDGGTSRDAEVVPVPATLHV